MTKPIKTEQEIITECIKFLNQCGFYAWRNNTGSFLRSYYCRRESRMKSTFFRAGVKGMPDILAVRDGRFYAIEVKTLTGRVSPEQKEMIRKLNDYGAVAFIARSLDELKREIGIMC